MYALDYYKTCPMQNPKGPSKGINRVIRGGSWYDTHSYFRVTNRYFWDPLSCVNDIDFRLVKEE